METNNNDIDLIEKYLNNELSSGEREAFDKRLLESESLAEEFQRRRAAHRVLDYAIARNLKAQLNSLEEDSRIISIGENRKRRLYVISAAACVLLLIGLFAILLPGGAMQPSEIAQAYYEPPDLSTRRGTEAADVQEDRLSRGIVAMQNKEYSKAIGTLDSIAGNGRAYVEAQYYLGHAFYLSAQYDQAEEAFDKVIASKDIRLLDEAEWYALLTCLMREADCSPALDKILNDTAHAYHGEALKIDKRLK